MNTLSYRRSCTGLSLLALSVFLAYILNAAEAYADITTEKWAKPWLLKQVSVQYYNPDVQRIAVMPFTVDARVAVMSESLMNQLSAAISGEGFIEVVSRAEMEGILGEQRFQQSGFADPATAKEVGLLLGVDAIIIGSAPAITSDTQRRQEQVVDYYKEIQKEKQVWNKEKQVYETKYYTEKEPVYKSVWVVEQWAHASLEAKLVDIETGGVLHATTSSGDYHNKNFDNGGTTYLDDAMQGWAVTDAINSMAKHFTPYNETLTTYFVCYSGDFVNLEYQAGWEAALDGDYKTALTKFAVAYRPEQVKGEREHIIIWDQAVVYATMGCFDEMDERIDFLYSEYGQYLEAGQKTKAEELRAFCARNFERVCGRLPDADTLTIVAVDGEDYYLSPAPMLNLSVGGILVAYESKPIINELTGAVIATKNTVIAKLEITEVTDEYVLCKLLEGSVKVGDKVKPEG